MVTVSRWYFINFYNYKENILAKTFTAEICESAIMQSPYADVSFANEVKSCDPLIDERKVIKLTVQGATQVVSFFCLYFT